MNWQTKKLLWFADKHKLFVHNNYLWKYDTKLKVSRIIWPISYYSLQEWKRDNKDYEHDEYYYYQDSKDCEEKVENMKY